MTSPGRSARATSTIRSTSCSARTRTAVRGDARQEAEARRAKPDLAGRFLARGIQDVRRAARRPGEPGRRLEQERRLADARARHRAGPASPGTSPPPRTRSSSPIPTLQARQVGVGDVGQTGRRSPPSVPARPAAHGPRARARGRRSRPGCSSHRRRGTALPSEGRPRRRTGRRSGSGAAPSLGRRSGGAAHRASTGVRGSARWMSRPASGSLSTMIVEPGSYVPSRSCSARTSSIMFWMTRRSGRAP